MLIGMVFGGFLGVVLRVQGMAGCHMGVVRRLFVIACFMMFGGFAVMSRCVLVVFRCFLVVFCACVFTHKFRLSCGAPISFCSLLQTL
jgi:hypothetical protein